MGHGSHIGSSLTKVPFGVPFIRVPYYIGDVKGDPDLENYPKPYALSPKP